MSEEKVVLKDILLWELCTHTFFMDKRDDMFVREVLEYDLNTMSGLCVDVYLAHHCMDATTR